MRLLRTMRLDRQTAKVFVLTWLSFAWFFSSVIPLFSDLTRSWVEWLARGAAGGFVVGASTAYFDYRRRRNQLAEPLPDEELERTTTKGVAER